MKNNNIRKITRISKYSYGITLPISAMRDFGWKERQKVVLKISKKSKKIIIEDWEKYLKFS
jgi:bifunctional DNA-binding transcriptional regulator/antitoxin component of YhaV-PrlF toxin-antitoxin module